MSRAIAPPGPHISIISRMIGQRRRTFSQRAPCRPISTICIGWLASDYRTFFCRVPHHVPLVWTLHDINPFTGGCHYTAGCERFTGACGACPALGSTDSGDLSAAIFRRKRRAFARLNPESVRIVTPSAWLCREASRSALFGKFDISTIPYGLDTEIFSRAAGQ